MAYVVTERCINCKYTECVQVCPVDCFHEGPNCVVIDPDVCISCGACGPVCPVDAIFEEGEVPNQYMVSIKINEDLSKIFPGIHEGKKPLPDADKWKDVPNKLQFLKKDKAA